MTRDEILNMPAGHEMDVLIVENVMGWALHPRKTHYINDDGGNVYFVIRDRFDPSTDIADAWQVVEKLRTKHNLLMRVGILPSNFFTADFFMRGYNVTAETAPLAICRAALLAVMDGGQ